LDLATANSKAHLGQTHPARPDSAQPHDRASFAASSFDSILWKPSVVPQSPQSMKPVILNRPVSKVISLIEANEAAPKNLEAEADAPEARFAFRRSSPRDLAALYPRRISQSAQSLPLLCIAARSSEVA
jgi:hypothetical protein